MQYHPSSIESKLILQRAAKFHKLISKWENEQPNLSWVSKETETKHPVLADANANIQRNPISSKETIFFDDLPSTRETTENLKGTVGNGHVARLKYETFALERAEESYVFLVGSC